MQTHSIQHVTTSQRKNINNGFIWESAVNQIEHVKFAVISESAQVAVNLGGPLSDCVGSLCY